MTAAPRQSAESRAQSALAALNALDPVAPRAEQVAALKNGLADRHFLVVSRAATLTGEKRLHELIPDLRCAFAHLLQDPIKRDPRCKAKSAIALALGESRRPEALQLLRKAWDELVSVQARSALIRAAALHRSEAAFEWLLTIIGTGAPKLAATAADALGIYERNGKLMEQVKAAWERRTGPR